jgi:hypothetical protein
MNTCYYHCSLGHFEGVLGGLLSPVVLAKNILRHVAETAVLSAFLL